MFHEKEREKKKKEKLEMRNWSGTVYAQNVVSIRLQMVADVVIQEAGYVLCLRRTEFYSAHEY